jgi:hypothetical protein
MMITTYLLNLVALLAAYFFYHSQQENRDINILIIYILIYIILFPIIASSNFESPDYKSYLKIINQAPNLFNFYSSMVEGGLSQIHGGIFWIFGISFFKTILPFAPLVLYIIVFFSIFIKVKVLMRHIDYFYVAIFLYMSHEVFFKEWIQIRHGLAVSFILLSFFNLLNNKKFKSYMAIVLAILIHKIAVVFIPFYLIIKLKKSGVNILLFLLPISLLIAQTNFPLQILEFISHYVKEVDGYFRWVQYQVKFSLLSPTLIKHYFFIALFVVFRKKLKFNRYFNPVFSLYLLSTHYFIIFSPFSIFANRAGASLYFSEAILLAIFVSMYKDKKLALLGTVSYGSVLFAYNYLIVG